MVRNRSGRGVPHIRTCKAVGVDEDRAYLVGGLVGCRAATLLFLMVAAGWLAE